MKKIVLKVELQDDRDIRRAMKTITSLPGCTHSIFLDSKEKKLTILGDLDPVLLVTRFEKLCRSTILSVGAVPAEREEETEEKKLCSCCKKEMMEVGKDEPKERAATDEKKPLSSSAVNLAEKIRDAIPECSSLFGAYGGDFSDDGDTAYSICQALRLPADQTYLRSQDLHKLVEAGSKSLLRVAHSLLFFEELIAGLTERAEEMEREKKVAEDKAPQSDLVKEAASIARNRELALATEEAEKAREVMARNRELIRANEEAVKAREVMEIRALELEAKLEEQQVSYTSKFTQLEKELEVSRSAMQQMRQIGESAQKTLAEELQKKQVYEENARLHAPSKGYAIVAAISATQYSHKELKPFQTVLRYA